MPDPTSPVSWELYDSNEIIHFLACYEGIYTFYLKVYEFTNNITVTHLITVNVSDGNTAPTFVDTVTSLTVDENSGAADIKDLLKVSDSDSSQALTWSEKTVPQHGTLSISEATASTGGTSITPGGTITYTPAAHFSGSDSFTVQVSDGKESADRAVSVNVLDKTAPTGMITEGVNSWTSFLNDITFGRFFKETVNISITAADIGGSGVKSIYIFGTAGEGYCLDNETFTQIVSVFLDECSKGEGVMPMTGIISTSMPEMIVRMGMAHRLGCRDFQVALPCWGALNENEVRTFFQTICGSYPDCRIICYNNGPRSKTKISVAQFKKLASEIPNLAGVKHSTPNLYETYDVATADTPLAFYLVDSSYTFGAPLGEVGFLNSFASIDLDLSWKYFYAGQKGDLDTLFGLGKYFIELVKAFDCVQGEKMDSALDKTIERVADGRFSNKLYPPYESLTETEFAQVNESVHKTAEKYRKLYL
jgi:VCBS repeat-containing protein